MTSKRGGTPIQQLVAAAESTENDPSWWSRHPWTVRTAFVLAALGGGLWWRRHRRHIDLPPVSEGWLQQHEYESGQRETE